jgi:hypothetical protein
MAPVPVMLLCSIVLFVVFTISFVSFLQVTSVGAVFVVIPVMVVTVIAIVDSHLNGGFLRFGAGQASTWRSNGRQPRAAN